MKKTKNILDAIALRQNTFKGKPILYLDSLITYGKYKDYRLDYIIENDINYVRWLISTYKGYISDELSNQLS